MISKRREIPQRDELLVHPKEHLQKWKPLHLCLAWVSQQELGQGSIWDRTRGLESCPKNRSQKLPSQSSTCSTMGELFPEISLSAPPKVKISFCESGVPLCWWREGGLGTSGGGTRTLLHLRSLLLPLQWVSPSHPGGCHLPLVLQPPGSLHQHLCGGRQREWKCLREGLGSGPSSCSGKELLGSRG